MIFLIFLALVLLNESFKSVFSYIFTVAYDLNNLLLLQNSDYQIFLSSFHLWGQFKSLIFVNSQFNLVINNLFQSSVTS